MILGKVIGSVVATRKNEKLTGSKFLIIEAIHECQPKRVVAIDNLGAGTGELVLVTLGSSARTALDDSHTPVDAMVVGIVDSPDKISITNIE